MARLEPIQRLEELFLDGTEAETMEILEALAANDERLFAAASSFIIAGATGSSRIFLRRCYRLERLRSVADIPEADQDVASRFR